MKPQNEEFTLVQKIKAVATMSLVGVVIVASALGYTGYQETTKREAAETAKTQLKNVAAIKAELPLFRNTIWYQEIAEMAITKISVDDLPETIEAGLMEVVPVNPELGNPQCAEINYTDPGWFIKSGSFYVENVGSWGAVDGWQVTEDGHVTIPAGAAVGKYMAVWVSDLGECMFQQPPEIGGEDPGYLQYFYEFKITPPCPTGVTLTAN